MQSRFSPQRAHDEMTVLAAIISSISHLIEEKTHIDDDKQLRLLSERIKKE